MSSQLILTNARIVTQTEVIHGSISICKGVICSVDTGNVSTPAAVDCCGDYVIPGLVELHTDAFEHHLMPRPAVAWPIEAALFAHDAQLSALGITTVLDALCLGIGTAEVRKGEILDLSIRSVSGGEHRELLRADHLLHLRLELTGEDTVPLLERYLNLPNLRLVSLMDHTPGQRQWHDLNKWKQFHSREAAWTDEQIQELVHRARDKQERHALPNRRQILAMLQGRAVPTATHDDTTEEHVAEAVADGVTISEFPTTMEASMKARDMGMAVIAGAPNLVRGESHSGNVSAMDLGRKGLIDALSSDYAPVSLLHGAFLLADRCGLSLPAAVRTVTATPAGLVNLTDRGSIEQGKRADLVRVTHRNSVPAARSVWREGMRVA